MVDEKDWESATQIGDLIYAVGRVADEADPKCLRLAKIIAS